VIYSTVTGTLITYKIRGGGKEMPNVRPNVFEESEAKVTTIIADDLEIKGTIQFKSSLMIKGKFEGEIISGGLLVVGPTASVSADIKTNNLISHGKIEGNVHADEQVILKGTSYHKGNITTPNVLIESGAIFNGSCIMTRQDRE
jgi:cytoskeletal protein CcmA (bactofilin family)